MNDNPFAEPDDSDATLVRPRLAQPRLAQPRPAQSWPAHHPAPPAAGPDAAQVPLAAGEGDSFADMPGFGPSPVLSAAAPLLTLLRSMSSVPDPALLRERTSARNASGAAGTHPGRQKAWPGWNTGSPHPTPRRRASVDFPLPGGPMTTTRRMVAGCHAEPAKPRRGRGRRLRSRPAPNAPRRPAAQDTGPREPPIRPARQYARRPARQDTRTGAGSHALAIGG